MHSAVHSDWHHPHREWFPINFPHCAVQTDNRVDFLTEKQRLEVWHEGSVSVVAQAKTGRGIVFPGCFPQVTVERLEQLWKLCTAREEQSADGGEGAWSDGCCQNTFLHWHVSYYRDLRLFRACLFNTICLFYGTETEDSRTKWASSGCFCSGPQPGC